MVGNLMKRINKTIKVKDADEVSFSYKKSVHGPILNGIADQIQGRAPNCHVMGLYANGK